MSEIIDNVEAWDGHTHQEVENHLKQRFAEIEGTTVHRTGINIVGTSEKTYVKSEQLVQFKYIVINTENNVSDSDFQVHITINDTIEVSESLINSMIDFSTWQSGDTIDTPNLYDYVKNLGDRFTIAIWVTSGEYTSQTKTVKYNATICKLSSNDTLVIDPSQLLYTAEFDTTEAGAHVVIDFINNSDPEDIVTLDIQNLTGTNNTVAVRVNNPISGIDSEGNPYTLSKGEYTIAARLILASGATSAVVKMGMIVTTGAQTDESFIVAELESQSGRYNRASIQVLPHVEGATGLINIIVYVKDSFGVYNEFTSISANNDTIYNFSYLVPYVNNSIKFTIEDTDATATVNFAVTDSAVDWEAASNPLIYLSAQGRSNSSPNKDVWEYGDYSVQFNNVLFNEGSGWTEQSYLKLAGGATCNIRNFYPFYREASYQPGIQGGGILNTGMTLMFDFQVDAGLDVDDKLIKCFSEDNNLGFYVTCEGIYVNPGVQLVSHPTTNPALDTTNIRNFIKGERINLAITVQPYYYNSEQTKHEVRYYINGELAGFGTLTGVTDFNIFTTTQELITFGNENGGSIRLYNFRYYTRCLSAFDILQTRTMDLDNAEDMLAVYNKNNFYTMSGGNPVFDFDSAMRYAKYLASQGKTDFAVWLCTNMCNGPEYLNNTNEHAQPDRVERFYVFKFKQNTQGEGIIDADNTFMVEGTFISGSNNTLRLRRQGTSTAAATKGNIRVDLRGNCNYYVWDDELEGFNPVPTTKGKKAKIWKINNCMPCYLLTCKKNPNDSTQARNLPTAKWVEESCRALAEDVTYNDCLTYSQQVELKSLTDLGIERTEAVHQIKTRQCIDGFPSVAFEINRLSDEDKLDVSKFAANSIFSGQFDMITDKTNMDIFGFGGNNIWNNATEVEFKDFASRGITDDDYSVEYRTNSSHITTFHECNLYDQGEISTEAYDASVAAAGTDIITKDDIAPGYSMNPNTAFQYRYPNDDRLAVPYRTKGLMRNETLQKLYDLVYSCAARHIGYVVIDGGTPTAESNYTAYGDPTRSPAVQADRNAIFKENVGKLVDINQILVTAIAIDRGLMIDQDAKNQFFTHFTGDGDNVRVTWKGVPNQTIKRLCLPGYDFDTSWQMDNNNLLRLPYDVLYSDDLYDSKLSGNTPDAADYHVDTYGCYSDFWKLIFDNFANEMKAIAAILYNKGLLTADRVIRLMHNNQVDYYNSIIFNANSEYSYTENISDYQKSHGAAREQNRYFVEGRLNFKAGETYSPGDNSGFEIKPLKAKFAHSGSASLIISPTLKRAWFYAGSSSSGTPNVEDGDFADVTYNYNQDGSYNNKTKIDAILNLNNLVGGGDNIFYLINIKEASKIQGLHELKITEIIDWGDIDNIQELRIGNKNNTSYINTDMISYTGLGFSENVIFQNCELLDLSGLDGDEMTTVNLKGFPNLKECYLLRMNHLGFVTLPDTDKLEEIYFPATLYNITIENKSNLHVIDGITNITNSMIFINSSKEVTTKGLELLFDNI